MAGRRARSDRRSIMQLLLIGLFVVVAAAIAIGLRGRSRSRRREALQRIDELDRLLAAGDYASAQSLAAESAMGDPSVRVQLARRQARALVGAEEYESAIRRCAEAF